MKEESFEIKKPEVKHVPLGCIREEFDQFSVFKDIRGVKYFVGRRKTKEEAEKLYWESK